LLQGCVFARVLYKTHGIIAKVAKIFLDRTGIEPFLSSRGIGNLRASSHSGFQRSGSFDPDYPAVSLVCAPLDEPLNRPAQSCAYRLVRPRRGLDCAVPPLARSASRCRLPVHEDTAQATCPACCRVVGVGGCSLRCALVLGSCLFKASASDHGASLLPLDPTACARRIPPDPLRRAWDIDAPPLAGHYVFRLRGKARYVISWTSITSTNVYTEFYVT
jgi:hypothetical protein